MATPGNVDFPTALDSVVSLFETTDRGSSTLASQLTAGATSAVLVDASGFPSSGAFTCENERIYYTGKSTNTLTGLVRGRAGSTDATHLVGVTVAERMTARHHSVLADAIIATETKLGTGASTPTANTVLTGNGAGTSTWSTTLALGTNPASAGQVRIPNAAWLASRNAGNSADKNLWRANASDFLEPGSDIYRDDTSAFTNQNAWISFQRSYTNTTVLGATVDVRASRKGSGTLTQGFPQCFYAVPSDHSSITANKTITGAASNGAPNLIRILAVGHGYSTGDRITIHGVLGTTEANGAWVVTNFDADHFDLQGSTFTNLWQAGGTQFAANHGGFYGYQSSVYPRVNRGGGTGPTANFDDVCSYGAFNSGTGKATDCIYIGRNATNFPASSEWWSGLTIDANCDYGIRTNGTFTYGLDYNTGTYTGAMERWKNAAWIKGRNAANSADLSLLRLNSSNYLEPGVTIYRDDSGLFTNRNAWLTFERNSAAVTVGGDSMIEVRNFGEGAGTILDSHQGYKTVLGDKTGGDFPIIGASSTTPISITANGHGYATGTEVVISGVGGNTAANGKWFITNTGANTFTLDTSTWISGGYSSGGVAQSAQVNTATITGASSSNPIVITTLQNHNFQTGEKVQVYGVGGNTNANGLWLVTFISNTSFSLDTSTFNAGYTSGGFATNRGGFVCYNAVVYPIVQRGSLSGQDDTNCFSAYNAGIGRATDAFYIGRNSTNFPIGSEWAGTFTIDCNADYGFRANGTIVNAAFQVGGTCNYGIDLYPGTYGSYQIRLKNNVSVVARNAADTGQVVLFTPNAGNELQIDATSRFNSNITIGNLCNVTFSTTNGTKFGTATNNKIGFWNTTPVIQQARPTTLNEIVTLLTTTGLSA